MFRGTTSPAISFCVVVLASLTVTVARGASVTHSDGMFNAADLIRYADPVSLVDENPDFTASGSPIEVRFWRANSGGAYTIAGGIDSWSMTRRHVPEPATLTSIVLAFLLQLPLAKADSRR
jgi:hypothetical protein